LKSGSPQLVELIWESLSGDAVALPLSEAHRATIDERLAEHERHPADLVCREELFAEARRG
jgi:putative addiction module component (TIGR02574 family)